MVTKIILLILLLYVFIITNIYIKNKVIIQEIKNNDLKRKINKINKYIEYINQEIEIYENR